MINKIAFIIIMISLAVLAVGVVKAKTGHIQYNCSDFDTQAQAQSLFEKNTKDIYGLDRNHNKVACENLPKGVL